MITLSWSCRLQQISFLALVLLSIANGQELVVKQQEISLDDATIILDCDSIDDVYWTVPPNFIKQQTNRLTVTMDSAKKYGTYKCFSQSAESSAATLIQTHELIRPVININLNESLTFVNLTKPYTIICPLNFGSKNTNWFRFDRNSQKWIQTRQNDWTTYQLASVTEADVTLWRCESANDFPVNGRRAASLFLSKGFAISSSVKLIARSELEAELIVLNEDQSKFLLECENIKTSPDEITWELKSILNSSTNNDYKRLGLDEPSVQREDNQNNIEITFEQHNLQISKCQPYNSGVYRCTLTDDSKRYARVHVKRKEPIIDRFGRQGAQKKVVNKGENVIFHCNYDKESVDVSNLMWTFRPLGSEMDVSSTVEYVIERPTSDGISVNIVGDRIRIEIQSFKTSNQGRYFCKFGEITDYTDVTVGADFDVQLIIKPAGTELTLTLTCSVTKNGIAESNNNYTFSYYEEFDANETRLANNRVARYGSKDRHFLCKATNRISKQTASSSPIQVRGIILTLVSDTPTGLRVDSPLTLRCVSSDSSIDNKMLRLNLGRFSAPRSSTTSLSDGTANFNYATVTKRRHSGDFQCVLDKTTIKSNIVKVVVCEKNELLCRDALLCYAANKNCDGRKDCADGSDEDRNRCMDCEPHSLKCQPINGRNPDVKCVLKHWICDGQNDCGNNWDEFADNGYCNKHPIPIQNCNACGRNETCCSDGKCFPRAYECDSEIDCSVDSIDETSCTCGQSSQLDIDDPLVEIVKPVAPGDSVEITCQVRGKERPTINWRFNWGHLPDDVRFVESMTTEQVLPAGGTGAAEMYTVKGKLLINNVNPKTDIGRYTCEAVTKCKRRLVPDYILRLEPQSESASTSSSFDRD